MGGKEEPDLHWEVGEAFVKKGMKIMNENG